jgi:hypothetical protein
VRVGSSAHTDTAWNGFLCEPPSHHHRPHSQLTRGLLNLHFTQSTYTATPLHTIAFLIALFASSHFASISCKMRCCFNCTVLQFEMLLLAETLIRELLFAKSAMLLSHEISLGQMDCGWILQICKLLLYFCIVLLFGSALCKKCIQNNICVKYGLEVANCKPLHFTPQNKV